MPDPVDAPPDQPADQPSAPQSYRQMRFRRPPDSTELIIVRHGESEALVPDRPFPLVDGHGDPELAPDGRVQAEQVGARLARHPIDAIYVTTLRRTQQTAAPLAARLGIEPVVEADLREVHLGEWEGELYRKHLAEGHPIALEMLRQQRWDVIPGAESPESIRTRTRAALERLLAAHAGQSVAVFTHGGIIGEICAQVTEAGRPFAFLGAANASITQIVSLKGRWLLRRFNDTAHLAGDLDHDQDPDEL